MTPDMHRRAFIIGTIGLATPMPAFAETGPFAKLEKQHRGRLGVAALDTATGQLMAYRADERFPMCSTFKLLAAAAILKNVDKGSERLDRWVTYTQSDLLEYAPVTRANLSKGGMTVGDLCAAAVELSDNTAGNLLIRLIGGPDAVTAFARSVGDTQFRLDRQETALNTAIPGDPRDTTTPEAMGKTLQRLALGDALGVAQRAQLQDWMRGNTTGASRIRAGIPPDWQAADKTGTGDYGSANDIAILRPPGRAPVVLAIYTTRRQQDAGARNDVIAQAARIAVDWLT